MAITLRAANNKEFRTSKETLAYFGIETEKTDLPLAEVAEPILLCLLQNQEQMNKVGVRAMQNGAASDKMIKEYKSLDLLATVKITHEIYQSSPALFEVAEEVAVDTMQRLKRRREEPEMKIDVSAWGLRDKTEAC